MKVTSKSPFKETKVKSNDITRPRSNISANVVLSALWIGMVLVIIAIVSSYLGKLPSIIVVIVSVVGTVTVAIGAIGRQYIKKVQHIGVSVLVSIVLSLVLVGAMLAVTSLTYRPSPGVSLTPLPSSGTILYQEDWSRGLDSWIASGNWKVSDHMLVNQDTQGVSTIAAPYSLDRITDYAVQVPLQLAHRSDNQVASVPASFGILLRSLNGEEIYRLSICVSLGTQSCGVGSQEIYISARGKKLAEVVFDPDYMWHEYRLEFRGNSITVFVDSRLFLVISTRRFLSSQVGLWSSRSDINIRTFDIIGLKS